MSKDVSLLPPKNQQKHLDKKMISLPSDFRHIAHISPRTPSEIDNIKSSDDVISAVNEVSEYLRPSSSNGTIRSVRLDDAFPKNSSDEEVIRGYENQPSSHKYENVTRPSKKKYMAPPPPPQETKPILLRDVTDQDEDAPVVFRSISKASNQSEPLPSPKINTAQRIEAPKANSVLIDRPADLGAFNFGLDDCIPLSKMSSPMKTMSPIHRPLAIPKEKEKVETPILSASTSPPNDYMSTIRSTSAQGKQILDDLDSWLDDLDDDDREKLSMISTDESGYPTLALEKDRAFMKHLVEKYELGVAPETIRLRKKSKPAPMPPFSARPISMPPNRPPPDYDVPSFDAPVYETTWDLPSFFEKRGKAATMPVSFGRLAVSSEFIGMGNEKKEELPVLEKAPEVEEQVVPIPKPRTKKTMPSEPVVREEEGLDVVGEEFVLIEETQIEKMEGEEKEEKEEEEEKFEEDNDEEDLVVTRF